MAYIRIDKDLVNDPRLIALAEKLSAYYQFSVVYGGNEYFEAGNSFEGRENRNLICNALLGSLVTLWCYADTHVRVDNTLPIGINALSDVVGLPVDILEQFPPEWLHITDDGTVELPGYADKNCLIAKEKRKEQTKERVRKWRERKAADVTQDVTQDVTGDVTRNSNASNACYTGTGTVTETVTKKEKKKEHSSESDVTPQGFASFWEVWPKSQRKTGKAECLKRWKRRNLESLSGKIIAHVEAMKKTEPWLTGFEPAPLTYINQRRWEDDLPPRLEVVRDQFAGCI